MSNNSTNGTDRLTARDAFEDVDHWLGTPVNGYLGSGYGSDHKSLLMQPFAAGAADGFISKMRADVPIVRSASPGAINLYTQQLGIDSQAIVVEVSGQLMGLPDQGGQFDLSDEVAVDRDTPEFLLAGASAALMRQLHTRLHAEMPSSSYW